MGSKIISIEEKWSEALNEALSLIKIQEEVQMGILELEPKVRLPEDGFSIHERSHEFSYVIEGEIVVVTEEGEIRVKKGSLLYNEPGTSHYTYNPSSTPAKALWILAPPMNQD